MSCVDVIFTSLISSPIFTICVKLLQMPTIKPKLSSRTRDKIPRLISVDRKSFVCLYNIVVGTRKCPY